MGTYINYNMLPINCSSTIGKISALKEIVGNFFPARSIWNRQDLLRQSIPDCSASFAYDAADCAASYPIPKRHSGLAVA